MILRVARWLWLTDMTSWPVRAFNFLWFRTFGYEEHLRARFELETATRSRSNVRLYAEIADLFQEA